MTKEDFILDIYQAVASRKQVIMMMHCSEDGSFSTWSSCDDLTAFSELLAAFSQLPFTGQVKSQEAFPEWADFLEDMDRAEIFGFELEDGSVQVSITPYDSIEKEMERQR